MIMKRIWITLALISLLISALACKLSENTSSPSEVPTSSSKPGATLTPLPVVRVQPGEANPDEPVFISGEIPYTSRFFRG